MSTQSFMPRLTMRAHKHRRRMQTLAVLAGCVLGLNSVPVLAQVLIEETVRSGGLLSCFWSGGGEVFQLQRRTGLDFGDWTDLQGGLTTGNSATVGVDMKLAFFRVVDLSAGEPTLFGGGGLDDLRALSPDLTFDHLIITGPLTLNLDSPVTLRVSHFTLTSSGSIGYARGECDQGNAPSLTLEATGQVNLGGTVNLNGASGTRVTSSATCNSCYGADAGSLQITAAQVRITGTIKTDGGSGSSLVSELGSSGCSGGDGGLIRVQAESILISQASIESEGGTGGIGYFQGDPNYGADGSAGELHLLASGFLQIKESELRTDGIATLEAPRASISSPIQAADLQVNIAGANDDVDPSIEILYPTSDMPLAIDRPLTIIVYVQDASSGIKELHVSGLGHDQIHAANELIDDRLTVVIDRPEPPTSLTVTATDNHGNQSSQTLSGLRLTGSLTVPYGSTYFVSDHLDLGEAAEIVVEGTLEIPKSGEVTIRAGSLTLADQGQIIARAPTQDVELALRPTLHISLAHDANLHGIIDLKGHSSMAGRGYDYAQGGGNFTLEAANIQVAGSIILDGGYGQSYAYGWPAQYIRQGGGPGGVLRLTARDFISVSGSLSVLGGDSGPGALGPCFDGGDAGQMLLTYGQEARLSNIAGLLVSGGTTRCSSIDGRSGAIATLKRGSSPLQATDYLTQDELEPNGDPTTASPLLNPIEAVANVLFAFAPLQVEGSIADPDPGSLQITFGDTTFPISDLYPFSTPVSVMLDVEFEWPSDADLELAVFRADTYELVDTAVTDANPETLSDLRLSPGDYLLGLWAYDRGSVSAPSYLLRIIPIAFP